MFWQVLLLVEDRSTMVSRKIRDRTEVKAVGGLAELCVDGSIRVIIAPKRVENIITATILGLAVINLSNFYGIIVGVLFCGLSLSLQIANQFKSWGFPFYIVLCNLGTLSSCG